MKQSVFRVRHGRRAYRAGAAFTLVELLVVIAIVGVLVSMLLPSLQRARRRASMVAGSQALRNVGLAMLNYIAEHSQVLPEHYHTGVLCVMWRRPAKPDLMTALAPYLEVGDLPNDPYVPGAASPAFLRRHSPETVWPYLANPWARDGAGNMFPFGWRKKYDSKSIFEIDKPSDQVALIDFDNELRREDGGFVNPHHPQKGPLYVDRRLGLFFDGHVDSIHKDDNFYIEKLW